MWLSLIHIQMCIRDRHYGDNSPCALTNSQKFFISISNKIFSLKGCCDIIRYKTTVSYTHLTVKQLERTRKSLEARLEKLQAEGRKDDVVTFEQLGVDIPADGANKQTWDVPLNETDYNDELNLAGK